MAMRERIGLVVSSIFYIKYSWLGIAATPRECIELALVLEGLGVDSGFVVFV
jgi:hypothetical protein